MGLGLGMAVRASAQEAAQAASALPSRVSIGVLSDEEAKKLPKRMPAVMDGSVPLAPMAVQGCPACMASAGGAPGVAHVGLHDSAPGYASVGEAGYPVMGGPAPIGVMRTNYSNPAMAAPSRTAPVAGPVAPIANQAIIPPPSPGSGQHHNNILATMLGVPRFEMFGAQRRERLREKHAAIRYDNGASAANSLPASMVYGR
jgi:hypothetical protein